MTTFLIQECGQNTFDIDAEIDACEELHIPYHLFKIIPTTNVVLGLDNVIDPKETYITRGGTRIFSLFNGVVPLKEMGIVTTHPHEVIEDKLRYSLHGVYHQFRQDYYRNIVGDKLLNYDAKISTYGELYNKTYPKVKFIKPASDMKEFPSGLLRPWATLGDYLDEVQFEGMENNTVIMVASEKQKIISEVRFICSMGKVITGSYYKHRDRHIKQRVRNEPELWKVANEYAHLWQPCLCYAMDLAIIEDDNGKLQYKIVEYNRFNCAGLYDCNVSLIFNHLANIK